MSNRTVHIAVYDTLADWEYGYAVAQLRNTAYQRPPRAGFEIRTVADGPVTTMGGMRLLPDLALAELHPSDSLLLILPGAELWDSGDELAPFAKKAREFVEAGVPVAAICGATAGVAREGLLDGRAHTGAVADYLAHQPGYAGAAHYRDADAVTSEDGLLITAGPTEPVAFAREVLARLDAMEPVALDAWYRLFRHSDASAFVVLAEAAER